jgi:hypothetical protein
MSSIIGGMAKVRLIGLWLGPHAPGWPDVRRFVDPTADEVGRDRIAQRLDAARNTDRAYMGYSRCRLCGVSNGSGEFTDGVLVWPEGLSHYVRVHQVRLPAVVEDILIHPTATPAEVDFAVTAANDDRDIEWWRSITADDPDRP